MSTAGALPERVDVCVVGGGQAGLAIGYHLQRLRRSRRPDEPPPVGFAVLDRRPGPGGAWADGWSSLELFSPAAHSSLPGWPMPPAAGPGNPSARHVRDYLTAYERRYDLPVHRPVDVRRVVAARDGLRVRTDRGDVLAAAVVSATGTWDRPLWPAAPWAAGFTGEQRHARDHRDPADQAGRHVLVVGGGNSGAQVAADLLGAAASVTWATRRPPRLLPDDVDGRVLFETATRHVADRAAGRPSRGVAGLGDVVAVPAVRWARDEAGLRAVPLPERLEGRTARWSDGRTAPVDTVVWCTGFRPDLRHLRGLGLTTRRGLPVTRPEQPTVSADDPRLLLVGYGDWCGPASATLIGVGRAARAAAHHAAALVSAGTAQPKRPVT